MKTTLAVLSLATLLSLSSEARDTLYGSVASEFKVKATVDSFTGKALSEPFVVQPGDDAIKVTFEIAKMETGKKKRDEEMMHMFHAAEFPQISGTAAAGELLDLSPGDEAELPVTVVMHGVIKEVVAKVSAVAVTDGGRTFDLEFPLTLSDFDLKAPSVMKIIRVNNVVQVVAHVTLANTAPAGE